MTTERAGAGARDWSLPEDGWDVFCQRAAGCRLLRAAKTFYEIASHRDQQPIREKLDGTVRRLLAVALEVKSEAHFRELMGEIDVMGDDLETAVREMRLEALTFRGQLDLFEKHGEKLREKR